MEDLNKHQLILLTLLVSFVTSIATGIITYSLLQEAPVAVTQTINRVVEKTIEQVVTEGGGKTIIKEVQIVNEEDLVLDSISKNIKSLVRLKTLGFDGTEIIVGLGLVVGDGIIVMDARNFSEGSNYTILFQDNKAYGVAKTHKQDGLVFLKVGKPASEKYTFYPATLGDALSLKLGQTVIALSGKTTNSISIGRVSELVTSDENNSMLGIITDIPVSKAQPGSPLLNLSGEIVGLEGLMTEGESSLSYFPISIVKNSMKTVLVELSK